MEMSVSICLVCLLEGSGAAKHWCWQIVVENGYHGHPFLMWPRAGVIAPLFIAMPGGFSSYAADWGLGFSWPL